MALALRLLCICRSTVIHHSTTAAPISLVLLAKSMSKSRALHVFAQYLHLVLFHPTVSAQDLIEVSRIPPRVPRPVRPFIHLKALGSHSVRRSQGRHHTHNGRFSNNLWRMRAS